MLLRSLSLAWLAAGAVGLAQEAPLRLRGIALRASGPQVLLTELATGRSEWSEPGQSFAGYVIAGCDARAGEVSLARNGTLWRLRLDSAEVPRSADDSEQVRAAILANLGALAAAGYQRCVETGQRQVGFAEIVGRDLPIYRLEAVAGEDYSHLVISLQACQLSVITQRGQVVEWKSSAPAHIRMAPGTSLADLSRATGMALAELNVRNPALSGSGTFPGYQEVTLP